MFNPFLIHETTVEPEFDIFDPPRIPECMLLEFDDIEDSDDFWSFFNGGINAQTL